MIATSTPLTNPVLSDSPETRRLASFLTSSRGENRREESNSHSMHHTAAELITLSFEAIGNVYELILKVPLRRPEF